MKRNAFTLIELVFVIVVIGILAAAAIPNFVNVKNQAKTNSEMASMKGIDAAILGEIEAHSKDYGDLKINWHNYAEMNDTASATRADHYKAINTAHTVLSRVAKSNRRLKIIGWYPVDCRGRSSYGDGLYCNPLMIEDEATRSDTGALYPTEAPGADIAGQPDKNDFWVFNPTPVDINISTSNNTNAPVNPTVVHSGEIKLIDVNGTHPISSVGYIRINGLANSPATKYAFRAPSN
ncbi:MAG: hypothetical protein B6D59_01195 [Campylobacteraceae bacterium 4484_4]|nr:MAG: hypothetical protein B6D59_01195 [Campylobacteraceae bacterium 4484_4]